jgi:hypothetical protein
LFVIQKTTNMRVIKAFLSFAVVFLAATTVSYAQPSHPNSPHDTIRTANITITYGRPYKKGRAIFGSLIPYGKTYRCGADEPTILTFAKDVQLAGHPVKAGKYSLFSVPNATSWTIILNSNTTMWGTEHDKHADQDVVKFDVPVIALSTPVEQLTMTASNKSITLAWDVVKVAIPVQF